MTNSEQRPTTELQAKNLIKSLGGRLNWSERFKAWRVRFKNNNEYYTTELDDAIKMARLMAQSK